MDKIITDKISLILEYSKKAGAEQIETMFCDNLSLGVSCRMQNIESIEQNKSCAFGIRVLIGKKQAFTACSNLDNESIKTAVDRAIEMAKATPEDEYISLPDQEDLVVEAPELNLFDDNFPSIEQMISDALEIEEITLSNKGITNSEGAGSSYNSSIVYLANSMGLLKEHKTTSYSKSISCIAGESANMQEDYDYSVARSYNKLKTNREIGNEAARRTIAKLYPKKIDSTKMTIILDPRVARGFMSSFASLVNGRNFVLGTSFLKDCLGKKIFSDDISVIDDPHIIGGLGSCPFDSEGVKNQKLYLVKNGILENCLLDTYNAKKLGKKTNGNAKRGLSSPTSPGTSNFYLANGQLSLQEMINLQDRVIIVTDAFSSNVNSLTGDISQGFSGLYYEKGKLVHPVCEMTFAGNLIEIYKNLVPANDLEFRSSLNSPSILIPNVTVAGK